MSGPGSRRNAKRRLGKGPGRVDGPKPLEKQIAWDIVQALRLIGFDVSSTQQSRASRQTVGMPDLYATHAAWGLRFWLEVKRLGGRVSKAQQAWHDAERAAGGIVLVATSAADALRQVERLRADRRMG